MTTTGGRDLDAILQTVREVERTLERRAERAMGAIMIAWGLAVASIFLFYHWVSANREAALVVSLQEAGVLRWAWIAPTAIAYAATAAVGARFGRVGAAAEAKPFRWLLLALVPPLLVMVAIIVLGQGGDRISGMWVLFLALTHWHGTGPAGFVRLCRATAVASGVLGLALLVLAPPWAQLAAGLWYLYALGVLGAVKFHAAR